MSRTSRLAFAAAALVIAWTPPAFAGNPIRPSFREALADYHDKELMLGYAFGPGAMDFALFHFLTLGVSADEVFAPQNWLYRSTFKLVDNPQGGLSIAFTAGTTQIRERQAGDIFLDPVTGWQSGLLVTLGTESGMTLRGGFQLYDTDITTPGGQSFLFSPEIAYRFSLFEVAYVPGWPLWPLVPTQVGLRLRI